MVKISSGEGLRLESGKWGGRDHTKGLTVLFHKRLASDFLFSLVLLFKFLSPPAQSRRQEN